MKNKDYPAYPLVHGNTVEAIGLTKRELIATMAMQALFSQPSLQLNHKDVVKNVCESSVKIADALLESLK